MDTASLIKLVEDETGASGVTLQTRFDILVEDSLEFLELLQVIENEFGFKVPDKKYTEVQTVGDLCSFAADYVSS